MITQEKIDRINELARKSRSAGLSPAEKEEQATLRQEYIDAYKASLRSQLDSTVILRPDGSKQKLSDLKKNAAAEVAAAETSAEEAAERDERTVCDTENVVRHGDGSKE